MPYSRSVMETAILEALDQVWHNDSIRARHTLYTALPYLEKAHQNALWLALAEMENMDAEDAGRNDDSVKRFERAETFVRDCFYLMDQPYDAANPGKVRDVAMKIVKAMESR